MKLRKEIEFNSVIHDILKNESFIELKYENHHGITRLDHSLNVAELTFKICKTFNMDNIEEVTRAALLHDFFKNEEVKKNAFVNHPLKALENSKREFELTKLQENIIASHMFPLSKVMPKYKESWIVSFSDKAIALRECAKYKVPLAIGTAFLFFINFAIIQR